MKSRSISFILGGDKFSGAEKRILETAILLASSKGIQISILISKQLKEEIDLGRSGLSYSCYNSFVVPRQVKFKPIFKYFSKIVNKIFYLYDVMLFSLREKDSIHVCLFSIWTLLALVPNRLFSTAKVCFEITSPDVSVSEASKLLLKVNFLSDSIVCVSDTVASKYLSNSGVESSQKKVRVRKFPYVSQKAVELQSLVEKKNIVIYAHRLVERKNPRMAANVFVEAAKYFPNWEFRFYGSGPLEKEVRYIITEPQLPNLAFLGYCSDLPKELVNSKIFVSLIYPDNYPSQSVFEALACANALLLADTGSSVSKLLNGCNGVAVPLDQNEIKNRLFSLIVSKDSVKSMCEESLIFFNKRFEISNYLEEFVDFL